MLGSYELCSSLGQLIHNIIPESHDMVTFDNPSTKFLDIHEQGGKLMKYLNSEI